MGHFGNVVDEKKLISMEIDWSWTPISISRQSLIVEQKQWKVKQMFPMMGK